MDFSILYFLQTIHNPIMNKLMIFFTTIGDAGAIWIALTLLMLLSKKYRKCGLQMSVSLILMLIIGNVVIKNIVARPRPCWLDTNIILLIKKPLDYSFPSGHTYASFAAATSLFMYHKKEGILAIFVAILISFSRLYLFVHFPTDVLGGMLLGISTAFAARYILNRIPSINRSSQTWNEQANKLN